MHTFNKDGCFTLFGGGKKGKVLIILVVQPEVQVRQVAMKFASTVFAPDHVPSRYLLLLAAGDP